MESYIVSEYNTTMVSENIIQSEHSVSDPGQKDAECNGHRESLEFDLELDLES